MLFVIAKQQGIILRPLGGWRATNTRGPVLAPGVIPVIVGWAGKENLEVPFARAGAMEREAERPCAAV